MIFTEPHEIGEYDLPLYTGTIIPVKYYIRLKNGITVGFINIESKEEIYEKNFTLSGKVGEDSFILSPDVINPDRPSYLITYSLDQYDEYLGLTQNVLVNFFRYYKDNGNMILCLARSFPELYWTPGWDPMIKLSVANLDNPLSPTRAIQINLESGNVNSYHYPAYYEYTMNQIQLRESFIMHCSKGFKLDNYTAYLHPTTKFVLSRPNGAIVNPSWSREEVLHYLNNPRLSSDKLSILWYPFNGFMASINNKEDTKEISSLDIYSNFIICGYSYQETVQIREALYRRMVANMPKQWEKRIVEEQTQ